ncbi:LysR family transcriptional regulator [Pseudoroseomonas cervicalis]|uniref:LysR family transcriptional regulator n=1 Tax=Teichococcus cervicalis TaxID=204525 RepID=UPI00278AD773|nr:LysR family transcriptional regulator [Pseudoroseomonas cervicalis]MDQ1077954.1 DNA-binding transcriptional LysR family regulator [Pseudoroseomonas cervicalis]
MIELRHLRYFLAVAEEGHMTRAAQRLGLQQPPLSQQIRALEAMLGVTLLRRLPRGVEPTAAGLVLQQHASRLLADTEAALEATRRAARGEEGRLALGLTSSAAFQPLVATVLRRMRQAAPGVVLALQEGSTGELAAALQEGRLDAAFIRIPAAQVPGLQGEPVLREEMLVALPDQHRLAAGRGRLALAELAGEVFILSRRPAGPGLYDSIIAACRAAGFSPQVGQETPRLVSTLSLVAAGLGLTIVPRSMARLEGKGITYRRLDGAIPLEAPLHLAWRAPQPEAALQRFIALLRAELAAEAAPRMKKAPPPARGDGAGAAQGGASPPRHRISD